LLALHRDLIAVRQRTPLLYRYDSIDVTGDEESRVVRITRNGPTGSCVLALNFGEHSATIDAPGSWQLLNATDDARYAADLAADFADLAAGFAADGAAENSASGRSQDTIEGRFELSPQAAVLLLQETH
jgi:hypothetical protein